MRTRPPVEPAELPSSTSRHTVSAPAGARCILSSMPSPMASLVIVASVKLAPPLSKREMFACVTVWHVPLAKTGVKMSR